MSGSTSGAVTQEGFSAPKLPAEKPVAAPAPSVVRFTLYHVSMKIKCLSSLILNIPYKTNTSYKFIFKICLAAAGRAHAAREGELFCEC